MNRGFITIGIDTEFDNIKYSYHLAKSIKKCDERAEVCLVVDQNKLDHVKDEYKDVFNDIIELPFGNTAHNDGFHAMNIWQLYHIAPWTHNCYIDSDTIFNNVDLDLFWDNFKNHDIAMSSDAKTFRNRSIIKDEIFEIEKLYNLPELFNNLIYFDKDSKISLQWFKMADIVFQNWREIYSHVFKNKKPPTFDKNILANIITGLLDMENDVKISIDNMYDLHNLGQGYWNDDIQKNWTDILNSWHTNNGKLIIENSVLNSGIIHYHDKGFVDVI